MESEREGDGQDYDDGRFDNMGRRSGDETVELDGDIEKETPKAVLFRPLDADRAEWTPKSQILETHRGETTTTLVVKEWIAKKNGFI